MAVNPKLRLLYVTWAFVETVLFGGVVYGWASLNYVLIQDGVFSELCDQHNPSSSSSSSSATNASSLHGGATALGSLSASSASTTKEDAGLVVDASHYGQQQQLSSLSPSQSCPARDQRFALVFTVSTAVLYIGTAVMGQLNFKYGTRLTRVVAAVSFTFGALLTGFTSHDLPWLIFPGLSLIAVGGMPLIMTNTQFSMLFTGCSSTVVSLLCGSFDTSSGVMLIVKLIHERGVPLRVSMLFLCGAQLLTLVNTFFFLPKGFISKVAPEPVTLNVNGGHSDDSSSESCLCNVQECEPLMEGISEADKELPSIKSCVLSPLYALHVLWMSILQLRFLFFISSLNTWLNNLFTTMDDVSHYTNVVQYTMMFGLPCSIIVGLVYDMNKRIFEDSRSERRRHLMPSVIPQVCTTLLGVVLSALVLVNTQAILYPTFIVTTVFRSFLYSMAAAYISVMFPSEYFGVLYGLMIIVSGAVGMAQYGLFTCLQSFGHTSVNAFLIAFLTVSLVHPVYQWISCRRAEYSALK